MTRERGKVYIDEPEAQCWGFELVSRGLRIGPNCVESVEDLGVGGNHSLVRIILSSRKLETGLRFGGSQYCPLSFVDLALSYPIPIGQGQLYLEVNHTWQIPTP